MVGESWWEQERPVSASAVRPLGEPTRAGGLGATNPISGVPDEMGESGAGVGGGHSSDEGENNRTRRSEGAVLGRRVRLTKRQRDCREAIHPPNHVSKGRLLGREANARGRAECRAPTARGRAVCGRIACTVQRGRAGNGAAACRSQPPRQPSTLLMSIRERGGGGCEGEGPKRIATQFKNASSSRTKRSGAVLIA